MPFLGLARGGLSNSPEKNNASLVDMSPNLDRQARFILHSSGASYWGAVHQAPLICRLPIPHRGDLRRVQ